MKLKWCDVCYNLLEIRCKTDKSQALNYDGGGKETGHAADIV